MKVVSEGMGANNWRMFARALGISEGEIQQISSSHTKQDSEKFTREVIVSVLFPFSLFE